MVDDEPDVLKSTQMQLEVLGYEAKGLGDAGQVLEAVRREQPALILQDLKMKGLHVAGLLASLRSDPATAEIPLVFFSADPDIADIAAKNDVWGYLRKPFTEEELLRVLDKALGGRPARSPAAQDERVLPDVRTVFHDYWNLLSALNSYAQVLRHDKQLTPEQARVVEGLDELIVKLEAKTDRLQSYLRTVLV